MIKPWLPVHPPDPSILISTKQWGFVGTTNSYIARKGEKRDKICLIHEKRHGERFTLMEAGTLLLLDNHRVIHESTPIQPTATGGHRDTLVLTFRSGGFLDPAKDDNVDRS